MSVLCVKISDDDWTYVMSYLLFYARKFLTYGMLNQKLSSSSRRACPHLPVFW